MFQVGKIILTVNEALKIVCGDVPEGARGLRRAV